MGSEGRGPVSSYSFMIFYIYLHILSVPVIITWKDRSGQILFFLVLCVCVCVCFISSKEFLMFFLLHWLLLHTLQRKTFLNSVLFLSYWITWNFNYSQERIQLETARLYKLAGINPLAGAYITASFCLQSEGDIHYLSVYLPESLIIVQLWLLDCLLINTLLFFPYFPGCLPTLATIPVWIGLYRALSNVADEVACWIFFFFK